MGRESVSSPSPRQNTRERQLTRGRVSLGPWFQRLVGPLALGPVAAPCIMVGSPGRSKAVHFTQPLREEREEGWAPNSPFKAACDDLGSSHQAPLLREPATSLEPQAGGQAFNTWALGRHWEKQQGVDTRNAVYRPRKEHFTSALRPEI